MLSLSSLIDVPPLPCWFCDFFPPGLWILEQMFTYWDCFSFHPKRCVSYPVGSCKYDLIGSKSSHLICQNGVDLSIWGGDTSPGWWTQWQVSCERGKSRPQTGEVVVMWSQSAVAPTQTAPDAERVFPGPTEEQCPVRARVCHHQNCEIWQHRSDLFIDDIVSPRMWHFPHFLLHIQGPQHWCPVHTEKGTINASCMKEWIKQCR